MESELLDARATRLDDGVTTVVLLGGFVFNVPVLVLAVAIVTAMGTILGLRGAPLVRAFHAFLAPQLGPGTSRVDPSEWRFAVALRTGMLAGASLLVFGGAAAIGWFFAIAAAVIAALDATTGISLGGWAYRRWRERA